MLYFSRSVAYQIIEILRVYLIVIYQSLRPFFGELRRDVTADVI